MIWETLERKLSLGDGVVCKLIFKLIFACVEAGVDLGLWKYDVKGRNQIKIGYNLWKYFIIFLTLSSSTNFRMFRIWGKNANPELQANYNVM